MHRLHRLESVLAFVVTLACGAACTPETSVTASAVTAPAQSANATKSEVTVYAATSTRDALQAIEDAYEKDHGVDLVFNFGSSGDLSKQLVAAAKADLFLSADDQEMDKVEAAQLVLTGTRRALLSNQLVVIEPADQTSIFATPFTPAALADPRVEILSLGHVETVPAGRYARAWLEKTGVWKDVADRVLPGVDVRAALAAVESAGAQAGIVYRTDVARSKKARIVFTVPVSDGPTISYPLAVIGGRPKEKEARAFAEFLASPKARRAFEDCGFTVLSATAVEAK